MLVKFATLDQIASHFPVGIYLLQVTNGNTRRLCEICSNLTIKTSERRQTSRFYSFFFGFHC